MPAKKRSTSRTASTRVARSSRRAGSSSTSRAARAKSAAQRERNPSASKSSGAARRASSARSRSVRTVVVPKKTPRSEAPRRGPSEAAVRAAQRAEQRDRDRAAQQRNAALDREREIDSALAMPVEDVIDSVEPAVAPMVQRPVIATEDAGSFVREREPARESKTSDKATRPAGDVVIDVDGLRVFYGAVGALKGISFQVRQGELVSIIGSNGAGKTTTMKTVSGVSEMLKTVRGHITIFGQRAEAMPAHKIARLGVAHVPEGRKIFPNQSVRDNLMLGAFQRKDSNIDADIEEQYERFPILGKRRGQPAGLMSGGEQQMLAIARGLMARPKIMLFDEPSMGLAPLVVKQVFEILAQLKSEGMTILLVEQMAFQALGIADRAYVLETGEITLEGSGEQLLNDPKIKEAYLGA